MVDIKIALILLLTAILAIIILDSVIAPITQASDFTEFPNLTSVFFTPLNNQPAGQVRVFNDTACSAQELTNGVDFIIDKPFNGAISGASVIPAPLGNGLQFSDGNSVEITTSGSIDFTGNHTIIGWVKPTGL